MGAPVFVVDDDPDIRNILASILELHGYEVQTASNGREALDRLRSGRKPALVLLDLMMPVMSGWDFREEQLRDPALARVPVVVLTGGGTRPQDAIALGAAAWLAKPVDLDRLLETVARYSAVPA